MFAFKKQTPAAEAANPEQLQDAVTAKAKKEFVIGMVASVALALAISITAVAVSKKLDSDADAAENENEN